MAASIQAKWTLLHYEVSGGGDIEFTLSRDEKTDDFIIRVSRYQFRETEKTFSLTRANSNSLYLFVEDLLMGRAHIESSPPQGLTGSWTEITLKSKTPSDELKVPSPTLNGDATLFKELYGYVVSYL